MTVISGDLSASNIEGIFTLSPSFEHFLYLFPL